MPLEGLQLGKYRLLRLIGSGGMGDVYIGEDARINRQVAIKVMRAEVSTYPHENASNQAERLFQREMRAIAALDHPHILPLYDYGEEMLHKTQLMYMVMPFRQEGSLADWLRQHHNGRLLQPEEIVFLVSQAADALQHAHDHRIIHQDVKPSNFLIRSKRDASSGPDLLLADFGIAKISSLTASVSQASRGTPTYMAPEQWSGDPVPATDQYALAIMTYELLTGRPPFRGRPEQMMFLHFNAPPSPPSTLNNALPVSIDAVILHALAKKPEERFVSVFDFAVAFQQVLQGRGDLYATLAIAKAEASTGTRRELTLPGGRKTQVSIPKGVQDGQVLHLEGLGEPYYEGGPTGALVLTIAVLSLDKAVLPRDTAYDETIPGKEAATDIRSDQASALSLSQIPVTPPVAPMIPSVNVSPKSPQKTKEQWLDEGDKFYSMRRYEQALTAYEQGLQLDPNNAGIRAKRDNVRDYIRRSVVQSKSVSDNDKTPATSRTGGIVVSIITIILFMMVNALAGWNAGVFSITTIVGLVVLFSILILRQDSI